MEQYEMELDDDVIKTDDTDCITINGYTINSMRQAERVMSTLIKAVVGLNARLEELEGDADD